MLYCIILYFTLLYYMILHFSLLHHIIWCYVTKQLLSTLCYTIPVKMRRFDEIFIKMSQKTKQNFFYFLHNYSQYFLLLSCIFFLLLYIIIISLPSVFIFKDRDSLDSAHSVYEEITGGSDFIQLGTVNAEQYSIV